MRRIRLERGATDLGAGIQAREQQMEVKHAALGTEGIHDARHVEQLPTCDECDIVRDAA